MGIVVHKRAIYIVIVVLEFTFRTNFQHAEIILKLLPRILADRLLVIAILDVAKPSSITVDSGCNRCLNQNLVKFSLSLLVDFQMSLTRTSFQKTHLTRIQLNENLFHLKTV